MRQLLISLLALALFIPVASSAQTNDCISYYTLSASTPSYNPVYVTPPAGCTGPIKTPITANPNGRCVWGDWAGHQVPASAASPAWFPDQKRSSLWFWEKTPTPANYADNWGTCDLALQWTNNSGSIGYYCIRTDPVKPYCLMGVGAANEMPYAQCLSSCTSSRNWVDINISPEANRYSTGQIIKFTPDSNILSTLTKFNWDFGDGIERTNEPNREEPVVYTTPGKKTITLSVLDPKTNKIISTSTEIKLKCVPPDSPPFNVLISMLDSGFIPASIASDNFADWSLAEEKSISNAMINYQCGYADSYNNGETPDILKSTRAIKQAKRITDTNQPALFSIRTLSPARDGHSIIALGIKDISDNFEERYSIHFLDPIGPTAMDMDCKVSKQTVAIKYTDGTTKEEKIKSMYCLHPLIGFVEPKLSKQDIDITESLRTAKSNFCQTHSTHALCKKRQNISYWLEFNYPFNISNTRPEFGRGVCRGWTEFVLKVAYLGNFIGECATTPTAAVPTNNSLASTGLLDFLNNLFNQLLRPILTN